jgi:ketosteroid isomerase-like protein
MSEANKAVAINFLTTLCAGDAVGSLGAVRGYQEILGVCSLFPVITKSGLNPKILYATAEDDRVSLDWEGNCELVSGERYDNKYHMLLFIRDGRVCKLKEYLCTLLAERVLVPLFPKA